MGEIIKHPATGEEIYIGILDGMNYSREALLKFKEQGFLGFYAGQFDKDAGRPDTLTRALTDPSILYTLPPDCPFDVKVHTLIVKNEGLEHDKVIVQKIGNRGSAYVYNGLSCDQKDNQEIYAVMIGERYDQQGQGRTIFACDCCEKLFSITREEAERLKAKHPYWAEWIKPNPDA